MKILKKLHDISPFGDPVKHDGEWVRYCTLSTTRAFELNSKEMSARIRALCARGFKYSEATIRSAWGFGV